MGSSKRAIIGITKLIPIDSSIEEAINTQQVKMAHFIVEQKAYTTNFNIHLPLPAGYRHKPIPHPRVNYMMVCQAYPEADWRTPVLESANRIFTWGISELNTSYMTNEKYENTFKEEID